MGEKERIAHLSAAESLLADAIRAGVEIRPIDGKVTVTGNAPPPLQARIEEHWPDILALFAAERP